MPIDLSAKKITLFPGINSTPVAPTASSGGNITYFYRQYNELIEQLATFLNQWQTELTRLASLGEELDSSFVSVSDSLTETRGNVTALSNTVTANKDNLQAQITNHNASVTSVQTTLASLSTVVAGLVNKVDNTIEPWLTGLDQEIGKIGNLESLVDYLNTAVTDLTARVTALEGVPPYPVLPENYLLQSLDLDTSDINYLFAENGSIASITVTGLTGSIYNIYFKINGSTLTNSGWDDTTIPNAVIITFDGDTSFNTDDTFSVYLNSGTETGIDVEIAIAQ